MWLLFGRLLALVVVVGSGAFAERGGGPIGVFAFVLFSGSCCFVFFWSRGRGRGRRGQGEWCPVGPGFV